MILDSVLFCCFRVWQGSRVKWYYPLICFCRTEWVDMIVVCFHRCVLWSIGFGRITFTLIYLLIGFHAFFRLCFDLEVFYWDKRVCRWSQMYFIYSSLTLTSLWLTNTLRNPVYCFVLAYLQPFCMYNAGVSRQKTIPSSIY